MGEFRGSQDPITLWAGLGSAIWSADRQTDRRDREETVLAATIVLR